MTEAAGVRLRPLREADLPQLHAWYQSPELWRHLVGTFEARTEAESLAYMRRWLEPSPLEVRFAVEFQTSLVGITALRRDAVDAASAELHMFIGDPERRRRGVGRAALQATIEHGFTTGLKRIELRVLRSNTAARRLYDRCGFRPLADIEAPKDGAPAAAVLLALERA